MPDAAAVTEKAGLTAAGVEDTCQSYPTGAGGATMTGSGRSI